MKKPKIIRDAERKARMVFLGIAIPQQPSLADGVYGPIKSEKVMKFNRKALRNMGRTKADRVDPRYNGGEDTMIVKVGKPGSYERKVALADQYAAIMAAGEELSPFGWEA